MVLATPFGKPVIWGDAIFLVLLACSAELVILRSGSFSYQVKFYSFVFMHKISSRVEKMVSYGKHPRCPTPC